MEDSIIFKSKYKHKFKMKIQEAFKQGKKIRREIWNESNYIYVDKTGVIKNNFNEEVKLNFLSTLNADDWEVFEEVIKEEEKSLSEHLEYAMHRSITNIWGDMVIRERYIKEFIKKLNDRTFHYGGDSLITLKDFTELVGDRLKKEIK